MKRISRPLSDDQKVKDFLISVLGYQNNSRMDKRIERIVEAEIQVEAFIGKSTLQHYEYRNYRYTNDDDREKLYYRIYNELISNKYSSDETKKKNGMKPNSELKNEHQAYIVIGLPASGKSTLSVEIANSTGSMILDSDIAKRKFPEFIKKGGATLVHLESSLLVLGDAKNPKNPIKFSVLQHCIEKGYNIVIQKIGDSYEGIRQLRNSLMLQGYSVHLILISLDREDATKRALIRFMKTRRYVPLAEIFDTYSNSPIITYFKVKFDKEWASVAEIDNFVPESCKPKLVYFKGNSPFVLDDMRRCVDACN
jgi:hypothetical protein